MSIVVSSSWRLATHSSFHLLGLGINFGGGVYYGSVGSSLVNSLVITDIGDCLVYVSCVSMDCVLMVLSSVSLLVNMS